MEKLAEQVTPPLAKCPMGLIDRFNQFIIHTEPLSIGHLIIPYLLMFRLAILAILSCCQPFFALSGCGRVKSCNMSANHHHGEILCFLVTQ